MSANLGMYDNRVAMFYVKEDGLPWHNEGIALDNPATWQEAVQAGGMNWKIKTETPFRWDPDLLEAFPLDDYRVLVRSDTQDALSVVSKHYKVIENHDLFNFVDPLVDEGEAVFRTAGVLGKGERVWALAKLPDLSFEARPGDTLDTYLLLTGAHDGKRSAECILTTVRVVCENTLEAAVNGGGSRFSVRHAGNVQDKLKLASSVMSLTRKNIAAFQEQVSKLVETQASSEAAFEIITAAFPTITAPEGQKASPIAVARRSYLQDMAFNLTEYGAGNGSRTLWDVLNGVTDTVDHYVASRARKSKLLFVTEGEGAKAKARALETAVAMAA